MPVKILSHCLLRQAKGVVDFANAQGLAAALVAEDEVRAITLIDSQVSQYFLLSDLAQCCPCYSYANVQKMPKQIIYSHLLSYANIRSDYFHQIGKGGDSLLFKFKYSSAQFVLVFLQFKFAFNACYHLCNNFLLNKLRELVYSDSFKKLIMRCPNIKAHIQPVKLDFETQSLMHDDPFKVLTVREKEIVQLCCDYPETSNIELANEMAISPRTFEKHLQSAYRKFSVRSRAELMVLIEPLVSYFY
ncbi:MULTISPECIES: response regulator transcription factor [Cysteiniphilum]|uniref:response regulator transcription factor n=1 Tax=Cysteiniphilum TaxID=2056696 RepID=UPI001781E6A3|nr:helix-turn-helix transcriptional regulator [Cysteiniphilum marinum]